MKQYFLLRSNRESGPFTLKELKAKGLFSADLLWIEGESNSWKHPEEFEELNDCLREAEVKQMPVARSFVKPGQEPAILIESENAKWQNPSSDRQNVDTECEDNEAVLQMPSFKELQKKYSEKFGPRKAARSQINIGASLFGLVVLVLGLSIIYVVVKNAVDNFGSSPLARTTKTKAEKLLQNSTVHAAHNPVTSVVVRNVTTGAAEGVKPATPDAKPQEKRIKTPPATMPAHHNSLPATNETKAVVETPQTASSDSAAEEMKTEEKVEPTVSKPALQVAANEYSVGLFGGISNLELSVTNASAQAVDQAVVEVEYMKKNGKLVGSKTVEVNNIPAGATKKVQVQDNSRGMQVRFHVVNK